MNKKLALLIGIMAFFAIRMTAQEYKYGIYLGFNATNMNITDNLYYDDSETMTRMVINGIDTTYQVHYLPIDNVSSSWISPLFTIGGYYEMPISQGIGFQFHLLYSRYGYILKGIVDQPEIGTEFSREYDYKGELRMSNLCASLLLKFNIPNRNFSFQAGVTPSYCIKMQKNTECGALHKTLNYKREEFKPLNICGTIGATYYFYESFMLSVNVNIGLVDVLKVKEPYLEDVHDSSGIIRYRYTDTKSSTNSIALTAGYRF